MDPASGDVLAMVSEPAVPTAAPNYAGASEATTDQLLDRARYALYPPGSTFKLVAAMAALRHVDPNLEQKAVSLPASARWPHGDCDSGLAQTHSR